MKKLTLRSYFGYAAGDLANNLAFSLQALFLLIYYTNVVGLNPAPIATMFLVVRVWDAFADLAAGRLVDLTRSRWGKFRPSSLRVAPAPALQRRPVQRPEFRQYDRQVHLCLRDVRPAGLPLLPDEHSFRFPRHSDDAGSGRALTPWHLALGGAHPRHIGARRGDRSSDHPIPDPT